MIFFVKAINKKRSSYFVTNYEDEQSDDAKWFDVFRVYLLVINHLNLKINNSIIKFIFFLI